MAKINLQKTGNDNAVTSEIRKQLSLGMAYDAKQ